MPKLKFDQTGERFYETGVSECVLFVSNEDGGYENGVAWNGITSVSESPEGADVSDIYADNIKYLSLMSAENFKATIEAYTYPDEFAACDGSEELIAGSGVRVTQQTRKKFAICYKTKIGNDITPEKGYKLHVIYNCLAAPSERQYQTVNESPEAMTFSWSLSTTPVEFAEGKYTAHLEIDSTKCTKMAELEAAFYGSDGVDAKSHLLEPKDIIALLNGTTPEVQE